MTTITTNLEQRRAENLTAAHLLKKLPAIMQEEVLLCSIISIITVIITVIIITFIHSIIFILHQNVPSFCYPNEDSLE